MANTYGSRGRYFEDFALGDTVVSAGRTITEADIVNFAGLSGDYTQIHTNAEFARQGVFGQRVAHGLLLMAIASGLVGRGVRSILTTLGQERRGLDRVLDSA